jgi:hypothetical protein
MTDVILKFDYIDDEILWPEFAGGRIKTGWVKAVSGIRNPLLNVARIKRLYVFDGKLYVLYDVEAVERYSKYMASLPPLAVELDYEIYPEEIDDRNCTCKIWRFLIDATYEVERLLKSLLGVDVEMEHSMPPDVQPANFATAPVDIALYRTRIVGIAVVENPRFVGVGREESTYEGRYVAVQDDFGGYTLYHIKDNTDVDLEKALETLTSSPP